MIWSHLSHEATKLAIPWKCNTGQKCTVLFLSISTTDIRDFNWSFFVVVVAIRKEKRRPGLFSSSNCKNILELGSWFLGQWLIKQKHCKLPNQLKSAQISNFACFIKCAPRRNLLKGIWLLIIKRWIMPSMRKSLTSNVSYCQRKWGCNNGKLSTSHKKRFHT